MTKYAIFIGLLLQAKGKKFSLSLFLYLFLLLSCSNTSEQENNKVLCFLSSAPDMFYEYQNYLSVIYQYKKDSLTTVDTLTSGKNMMTRYVGFFPSKGAIFLYEESELGKFKNNLVFVDTKNLQKKQVTNISKSINPWPVLIEKQGETLYCLNDKVEEDTIHYFGYGKDLKMIEIEQDDFKNTYLQGVTGAPIKNELNKFLVYTNPDDGRLRIPVSKNVEERPIFPIEIPEKHQIKEKKRLPVYINNENIFAIKLKAKEGSSSSDLGTSKFLVKNKINERWNILNVPGDATRIQSFGKYITGSIVCAMKNSSQDSPGKTERRQIPSNFGPGFDIMVKQLKIYYPGKLFLYDGENQKKVEWSTGQGDSEVLLVQDSFVYYRVNDKIFKAQVFDSKIGTSKLLIQDERVTDIHWAFFSN